MNKWLEDLQKFNFNVLEDPEFKEDSVREEILTPLIKALGYDYSGKFKIVRSRKLTHPFNMIGSKSYKISIIPDYILECDGKCLCIIEAKAPSESLDDEHHVGQAYSYAVHREVAARFYALCNGKEFRLYDVSGIHPIIVFDMSYISNHFHFLNGVIGKDNILKGNKDKFAKDLGIHFKMLSLGDIAPILTFMDVPITQISLVENDTYTIDFTPIFDGVAYCGSFDFSFETLMGLNNILYGEAWENIKKPFEGIPAIMKFTGNILEVGIQCRLGEKIYENENEHYMPFIITKFLYSCWKQ